MIVHLRDSLNDATKLDKPFKKNSSSLQSNIHTVTLLYINNVQNYDMIILSIFKSPPTHSLQKSNYFRPHSYHRHYCWLVSCLQMSRDLPLPLFIVFIMIQEFCNKCGDEAENMTILISCCCLPQNRGTAAFFSSNASP